MNRPEIKRTRLAFVGIDDCDTGVAQRGVDGKYPHHPSLRSPLPRSTPKLSGSTLNRQNPEQRFYSRQHGESFEERDWPGDRQANRVRGAHRDADDWFKRPVIFRDDQRFEPNRNAGPARTGRSFAQFPGTERADRKPVRTSSRDGADEMG